MKILIVDDQKEIVQFLSDFLSEKGHQTDAAYNGQEAVKLLQSDRYDLIFTDHEMPEMNGIEFIKFCRQQKIATKIILTTGYPVMKDFFAKAIGADEYLQKPFSLESVEALMKKYSS